MLMSSLKKVRHKIALGLPDESDSMYTDMYCRAHILFMRNSSASYALNHRVQRVGLLTSDTDQRAWNLTQFVLLVKHKKMATVSLTVQTVVSLRVVTLHKMDLSAIRFVILVLFGLVLGGSAQVSPQADRLLNQTEANLRELVNQVRANDLNSCDLLSTCNAESTCSRLACPLTNANTTGYACQGVLPNTNCKDNCPWRNFDFSRSFLRVPGVYAATDYITPRQLREICAQRNLDSFFQKLSNNTNFFRLYFGSVDGTFRIFPGMDQSDCGSYDPRLRLWYLTSATNVKKAVMVLIDSGSSMAEIIPSTRSDSNFAAAFRVTEIFLNTTTKDDYVNIFTFDQAKVEPLSVQPVKVTNTSSHPDFGIFTATLSSPNQSSVPPGNITDAITKVITTSAGFGSTEIPSEYLKVIILITDSKAVDAISNAALPWDLIKNNSLSVFLYMFPPSTAAIDASPLASQLCAARGYFEILDDTVFGNPLLALEAYYSFVANVHSTYVNSGIDYSTEYQDYSQVDNRTFTLSKAVFSSNGELVGVAAINIFKTKLLKDYGIDGPTIEQAVRNRANLSSNFNASTGINTITCLNKSASSTCNQPVQASNIVCSSNFDTDISTLRKLSCCGTCTGADKPQNFGLVLGLGLGLGIPALILVMALVTWLFTKYRGRRQADEFSGQSGEEDDMRV